MFEIRTFIWGTSCLSFSEDPDGTQGHGRHASQETRSAATAHSQQGRCQAGVRDVILPLGLRREVRTGPAGGHAPSFTRTTITKSPKLGMLEIARVWHLLDQTACGTTIMSHLPGRACKACSRFGCAQARLAHLLCWHVAVSHVSSRHLLCVSRLGRTPSHWITPSATPEWPLPLSCLYLQRSCLFPNKIPFTVPGVRVFTYIFGSHNLNCNKSGEEGGWRRLRSCVPPPHQLFYSPLLPYQPSHFEDLYLGFRWGFPVAASPVGFGS